MILDVFSDGFTPDSRLLLIGVRTHTGEFRSWKGVEEFLDYFLGTDDKIIVGFNLLKFGMPFLLLKARNSERLPDFFKKLNYSNVVDLFPILTFQNQGLIRGLDFHLEKSGIKRDFLSDMEIARKAGREDVGGEVKKKLEAINGLYWKLKKEIRGG